MQSKAEFILSKSVVKKQIESLNEYSDEVSYSLKTNYEVGKVLEEISLCSFSVHSIRAAKLIKDKSRVWFFAQAWSKEEIALLIKLGIRSFVVDNKNDLDILLAQINGVKINLLLRMRLKEHTIHTGKHFVYGFFSDYINQNIPKLRENKSIIKLGIHFHRKTQNISEWSLKQELEQSLSQETLSKTDLVNIGGGLPGVYRNYREGVMDSIFEKITEVKDWLNSQDIKMIIEPGRYIAAPAVMLVTKIMNIYDSNIVVNCSVYNSAMDTFVAHIRLIVEGEVDSSEGEAYTIKGCTPDSMDILRYKVYLKDPKVGDSITFLNAGAYNFSTDFCLLPKLKTQITKIG